MLLLRMTSLGVALALLPAATLAQAKTTPKDARIYIMYPEDGATETGAFLCRFGLRNMGVAPAGQDFPNTGHHHLLVDTTEPIIPNEPIPHDKQHLHFGGGETEVLLDLPPGKHTLQLVLGDGNHISFDPPLLSKKITITVKADEKPSRHRSHHGMHRTHVDQRQVEPKPTNGGQENCSYTGLWGWIKGCHTSASTPAKPPTP
jgi:Domain of unknown function (DUF4399)